jgi:prepilin-type N-terminal cleavage/methylation domain-containing protein
MKSYESSRGNAPPPRSGFTLVELLVVVAIMVLLFSLLLPAIERMMHEGRMVLCATRLGTIARAAHAYAVDNDGDFSGSEDWIRFASRGRGGPYASRRDYGIWAGDLYPYIGQDDSMYICPEFTRVHTFNLHPPDAGLTPYYSYTMNGYFRKRMNDDGTAPGWMGYGLLRRSNIKYMSELAFFGEENPYVTNTRHDSGPGYNAFPINDPHLGPAHAEHTRDTLNRRVVDGLANYHRPRNRDLLQGDGYANVVFMDGSLQAVHASRTIEVFTPRGAEPEINF